MINLLDPNENWEALLKHLIINPNPNQMVEAVYVLNPTTFKEFFTKHLFSMDQQFAMLGWVEANKNSTLRIELTRQITQKQWQDLLTECQKHQVILELMQRPWHHLPELMNGLNFAPIDEMQIEQHHPYVTEVFITDDVKGMVYKIRRDQKNNKIEALDVTGFQSSRMVSEPRLEWQNGKIAKVKHFASQLLQDLQNGQNIILHGHFTQECIDQLAKLCIQNAYLPPDLESQTPVGKLYIVTKQKDFPFATRRHIAPKKEGYFSLVKSQLWHIVNHPTQHPVLMGFVAYLGAACFLGIALGIVVGWAMTLAVYLRNDLLNDFEQSHPVLYATEEENTAAENAYYEGYVAGQSWLKYFESFASFDNWDHYPEYSAGMIHGQRDQEKNLRNKPNLRS